MPQNDRDKLNRLEELKVKLFSKDFKTKIEHRDSFSHISREDVPQGWDDKNHNGLNVVNNSGNSFFMKTSIFKHFFIFAVIFFILAAGYASYVFFGGGNTVSNNNIDISVLGNTFTAGGDDLPFVVSITNKNSSPLELVDLVMDYPKGSSVSSPDAASDTTSFRESLGTIPAGAVVNENLKVVLFGEQGSTVPIKISIEYRVAGSNAIFVKATTYNVNLTSTPINLSVDAPANTSPNQNVTLTVKASLNATQPVSQILLRVDYPAGFQFTNATPAPTLGNNIWSLGDLAPGAESDISITGKMIDATAGEEKTFQISTGSQSLTDKSAIDVVYNTLAQMITIDQPFVAANILINGVAASTYAVDSKNKITGEIDWTNNLDTQVNDMVITAKISGNAVNPETINGGQGFYDSANNTITWDKTSVNDFSQVNPGDSGTVNFSMSPLSLFSSTGGMLASPTINVDVSITGSQSLTGFATQALNDFESAVINIISDVGLSAKALYYSGPFMNHGPIPPKVGVETTYTVVWSLSNTANNISNAAVHSTLPSWIRFAGTISPADADLTYNASTREIVWNIGSIAKGTGVTGASESVAFQVGFTPSLSQVDAIPVILNDAVLTGHDDFANVDVTTSKTALRTELDSDPTFPPNGSTVTQ